MIDFENAMTGIELAMRRVSSRLKSRTPWDMAVTEALDELAEEIATIAEGARRAAVEASGLSDDRTAVDQKSAGSVNP